MKCILVDKNNWAQVGPELIAEVSKAGLIGFDIETHDADAHEGIKRFRKSDTARVFDINRTTVTGFSIYPDGGETAYYVNLAHADLENRLSWQEARKLLEAKRDGAHWLCHNAPFEITMMKKSLGYELRDVICTMQMAVSVFGPDEYPIEKLHRAGLGAMQPIFVEASKVFATYDREAGLTTPQYKLLAKVLDKRSKASHSYNGFVRDISYGYALKKLVNSLFGYKMTTFDEVLNGRAHMGMLTGPEVLAYGADDAYWAVQVFHELLTRMAAIDKRLIDTFLNQENTMVPVYADLWQTGLRVNIEAVGTKRGQERSETARLLREMRTEIRSHLPFASGPNRQLMSEDWYSKNWATYRDRIEQWALLDDATSDYEEVARIPGAVSTPWRLEQGDNRKPAGPNFTHYMVMRTLFYDLLGLPVIRENGKVQSDGDSRGDLIEHIKANPQLSGKRRCVEIVGKLASIEQRLKTYINPYLMLTDPDTSRMHPVVSSKLATRRMASENPNGMALAKQGESTYIRGFFIPDEDDHLLVSLDLSQIELVLIGEFSQDPTFKWAYEKLPYQDLHALAAVDLLSRLYNVDLDLDRFKALRSMPDDVEAPYGFPLVDQRGNKLTPAEAYKFNRGTAGGKGCNFNYWYSGALSTVAQNRGLTSDEMWDLTEAYRDRFKVAEQWRVETIDLCRQQGYVTLPDGHRRTRYEMTSDWRNHFQRMIQLFGNDAISAFGSEFMKGVQRRAGNQTVNALVQGTCSTLIKRSIVGIRKEIAEIGMDAHAVFKMPVHDETLYSVRRSHVVEFIRLAKRHLTNHRDIIRTLAVDSTASIGWTFQPFHPVHAPLGQIELNEAPKLDCLPPETENKELNDEQIEAVIEWISWKRDRM